MNSLERTQKALKMEKIDRIPTFPLIDIAFASSYLSRPMREVQLDPRLHANALNTCADELPVDGVYIMSTGCLVPRDSVVESFHVMARICDKQSK